MKTSTPAGVSCANEPRSVVQERRRSPWAGVIGVVTAMSIAACSVVGGKAAEEPAFRVVVEDGDFEVREYDSYAVAEVVVPRTFDSASRVGFRWLVRYISGANEGKQKIQMTAPVELQPRGEKISMTAPVELKPRGEKIAMTAPVLLSPAENSDEARGSRLAGEDIGTWSMAFVLPEGYTSENAPTPTNPMVKIRDVAPRRVAGVRFGGFLRDKPAEEHRRKLAAWLDQRGIEHQGDWRVAGYNPPWTIPQLRRNEVMVTLR